MQVCGAFCSGYWALKPFGSRIASVLRTSATAYAVYLILSALKMLRIFIAKKSVFLRKPHRLCKSTSGKYAMRI